MLFFVSICRVVIIDVPTSASLSHINFYDYLINSNRFSTWVVLSTFIGQTLIDYVLRIYKRSSIIVLSIASIIGVSMVMMTITGSMEVIDDIRNDANMGMSPYKLCK